MPPPARPTGTLWQRLVLVVSAPVVFLLLFDVVIRVSGIETDVARNKNFEIGVPVWALGDENWVDIQRVRLEEPRGVKVAISNTSSSRTSLSTRATRSTTSSYARGRPFV